MWQYCCWSSTPDASPSRTRERSGRHTDVVSHAPPGGPALEVPGYVPEVRLLTRHGGRTQDGQRSTISDAPGGPMQPPGDSQLDQGAWPRCSASTHTYPPI